MTHAGIWALDDQDAGVSLASAMGSTIAIFATYLLGAALFSPVAGLLAALLTATELELITWGVDGWRDDVFMAAMLLSAWAMLRLRERPTPANALLAGTLCAASCLTRITAITFVVPALIWLVADRAPARRRDRARAAGIAAAALVALVGPYLISCAIATGDPLLAINYHTSYYRFAEDQPIDKPVSAAEYLRSKFAQWPIRTLDTGINGLFVQPFVTKWHGFNEWMPGFGALARAIAVAGLAVLPFSGAGRLVLVAVLGSLVPYMFTWNVGGGGAWRFTMHAYPVFFIAAAVAVVGSVRAVKAIWDARATPTRGPVTRPLIVAAGWRAATVAGVVALGSAWYYGFPWLVAREAIAHGESTSLETGVRDRVFYRSGWSRPHVENITVRISRADRSVVHLPLPQRRAYDIVLRLDPVTPTSPEFVDVLFNRHLVGRLRLSWTPDRVGSYRIRVREDIVNAGRNELIIIPSATMPAEAAGPRFAWLDRNERIGVRVWYVRVLP
jgi:4-amino-4-deoxy-L-arabinose transferase-like glycosyltransferase